jgi:heptosyltransferase-2/heptosyltransferase-3
MLHLRRSLLRIAGLSGRLLGRRRQLYSPRRILVVKPDHLGDVLLLTPALVCLRAAYPTAHITLMIGPWSAAAVWGNPMIDTILHCAFPGFTRQPKPNLLQPYLLLLKTAALLRPAHYDLALIARDDHWWGALLALFAGIPRRIGFAAPDVVPLLTEALPYDPSAHVARQSLELVARLSGQPLTSEPPMLPPISPDDERWAGAWLAAHGCAADHLVAIHPGAGGGAKLWPSNRWTMIANELSGRGWTVILTAGAGERHLIGTIASGMLQRPLELVGEATLGQLAALYRRCALVLGVDSGPLHLATAAGARTVALFGPIDHRRFGPWGSPGRHLVVRSGLWCSPCGAVDACPRGTVPAECMTTITIPQLLAAAERHITKL